MIVESRAVKLRRRQAKARARQARTWYRDSRRAIKRAYGPDWKLFAGFLAATSPNSTLKSNVKLARKAYHMYKSTGTIARAGFINTHYVCLMYYLEHGTFRGMKTKAFYANLLGDETQVTVDIWIMRAYGYLKLTPKIYNSIASTITRQAEAMTRPTTPAQLQAILWADIRQGSQSFATYLAQYEMPM